MLGLPTTATAPFCPSEVRATLPVGSGAPLWKRLLAVAGPGLLVSVGYMDPGNWATDIEAGSRFGTQLLGVVVLSSIAAIFLQWLAMRLGVVTGKDLARHSQERFSKPVAIGLWLLAEVAIVACDLAEVLGSALAFHLLLKVSLPAGVLMTGLDTVIVLALKGRGFRNLEAIVLALIAVIGGCFLVELALVRPHFAALAAGAVPSRATLGDAQAWYLAVGILGATVMPHNLYLHSSIVQTRALTDERDRGDAVRLLTVDTVVSLLLALLVNAAILVLAAAAFHATGNRSVTGIEDAYHLLDPIVGSGIAAPVFAVGLLAAGQSSTFTGTIAGQVLMEGFLSVKIPCWQRRLITRVLAIAPALAGVIWLGDGATGRLLVVSQVVLSFQLPFAIVPLLLCTSDRARMGAFASGPFTRLGGWAICGLITFANLWLIVRLAG